MDSRTPEPGAASPRAFAMAHQRPKLSFKGCSRINDYEILGKLGEGTFGYDASNTSAATADGRSRVAAAAESAC